MRMKGFVFLAVLLVMGGLSMEAQQGGYKGPGSSASTVAEAKRLRDDSPVTLQGKIERSLGDETYLFSDDTGTVIVEIDKRVWGNLSVDENDVIEISGEIEGAFRWMIVEVKTIKKL
jgi:uncharacterized protein (TIGR00156 family)